MPPYDGILRISMLTVNNTLPAGPTKFVVRATKRLSDRHFGDKIYFLSAVDARVMCKRVAKGDFKHFCRTAVTFLS